MDDGEWKSPLNVGYKGSVDLAEPSDRGLHDSFSGVETRRAWIWPDLRIVESLKNVTEALIERKVEIWPKEPFYLICLKSF